EAVPDAEAPTDLGWPRLVLENAAGSGDSLGVSIDDLAECMAAIDAAGVPLSRIGVCLDSAHLWGAGVEISRPDVIDDLLDGIDQRLGPDRLAMIHLNDSKAALGSHLDRHEHIGAGRIGEVGMGHLVTHPRLASVPMFLETPGMSEGYDLVNMARVRALVDGRRLEVLPPEAFALRGSRASVAPTEDPA
ncbi:MAG TPA: TIM barrel protein, partial [Candidatus Limnocylindrales bacterium]